MSNVGIKVADLKIKSAGPDDGLEEGQFIGYASVFGNPDSYGDIVEEGAFLKTLAKWLVAGDILSCLWAHDMSDPFSNIGEVLEAKEDEHGLRVFVQLELDNAKAMQVYKLAKGRRLRQMSFAYDIIDAEMKDDGFYHLKELELYEVSLVPLGANQLTDVIAIKSLSDNLVGGVKAGRSLSSKNEKAVREAVASLQKVLDSLGDLEEEKANTNPSGKAVEELPQGAKTAEDPASEVSVDSTALELELLGL